MVEKNVILCDCCNVKIAKMKCDSCGGDLCTTCAKILIKNTPSRNSDCSNCELKDSVMNFQAVKYTDKGNEFPIVCSKCITELRGMFNDLSKMKPEEQKIFLKDLIAFIRYRFPQINVAVNI